MTHYDYIIVGAGSAGCVLANKLSADPDCSVLVLEAGIADTQPEIAIPYIYSDLLGSVIDWGYRSEQEINLKNRQIALGQGKVLGGSSSINAMMYVRGNAADFDQWQALGNEGWGYQEVLPYFKEVENNQLGASQYNGGSGPLHVACNPHPHNLSLAFIKAAMAAGFPENKNFNGQRQFGVGLYSTSIKDGKRHSAAAAFLHPVLNRANLQVITQAFVAYIHFEKKRAVGVSYIKDDKKIMAFADQEIIISAGALNTPKILMLSGIGPADHLAQLNIPVVSDLPGVGCNLQDHPNFSIAYAMADSAPPISSNGCEAGLFTASPDADEDWPDLQLDTYFDTDARADTTRFVFSGVELRPKSRGRVSLRTPDIFAEPVIQLNYLQDERDVIPLVYGVKLTRQIAQILQHSKLLGAELIPGSVLVHDEATIIDFIRENIDTTWHPAGTCQMGKGRLAVVNAQLQVYGVEHLRVIDASIMPTITSGNTNAPCIMIGAKGADLVLHGK